MESVHRRKIRQRASNRQPHLSATVTDADDDGDTAESHCAAVTDTERSLGVLLESCEDLLLKVLSCVMDDGLHECRRVCRRWRDACGKLPVKLGCSCPDKLSRVADIFPEATTLMMTRYFDSEDDVGKQAMQRLARMKNLQHLGLSVRSGQADINSLVTSLPSTDCLRSLCVTVDQGDKFNDVVNALRILTNLEALTLSVSCFVRADLDPVTELQGLGYLSIDIPVAVNSREELLFPSLTRLTHLEFLGYAKGEWPDTSVCLQVCESRELISYHQVSVVLVCPTVHADSAVASSQFSQTQSRFAVIERESTERVLSCVRSFYGMFSP